MGDKKADGSKFLILDSLFRIVLFIFDVGLQRLHGSCARVSCAAGDRERDSNLAQMRFNLISGLPLFSSTPTAPITKCKCPTWSHWGCWVEHNPCSRILLPTLGHLIIILVFRRQFMLVPGETRPSYGHPIASSWPLSASMLAARLVVAI